MTSRAARPLLLLPMLFIALGLAPAYADSDSFDHLAHHAPNSGLIAAALLTLGGLAMASARRRARTWVLALALLVAFFGVESAVHSVHHLGDPEGEESCPVVSASQNVSIAGGESTDVGAPIWIAESPAVADRVVPRPLRAFRFDEGRAPPPLPSA